MFRAVPALPANRAGFPRASGDVPGPRPRPILETVFSPRERGCSELGAGCLGLDCVFPARAGMFPAKVMLNLETIRFPRASGDVPQPPRR